VQVLVTRKDRNVTPSDLIPSHVTDDAGDRIRTDVVEVGILKSLGSQDFTRPASGGHSISPADQIMAGTLGMLVRDRLNDDLGFVTNNHVAANEN